MATKIVPEYIRNLINFLFIGERVEELTVKVDELKAKVETLTEKVEKIDQEYVKSEKVKYIDVLEEGHHESKTKFGEIDDKTLYITKGKQGKADSD